MSSVSNEDESKVYVVTYKELIFITIVFLIILIVLYPKDLLKQQIQAETSSYELSMLYLENLLEHSPDDESLMLILAEQSLRSGKKELAFNLLNVLLHSKNRKIKTKATLLEYDLKKDNYYYLKDEEEMAQERKTLQKLFAMIFSEKLYDENNYEKWYNEAMFNANDAAMYHFIEKKLVDAPNDLTLLKQAYYLSSNLKEYQDSLKFVKQLVQKDRKNREKWLDANYYTLVNLKQYRQAEDLIQEHAATSPKWRDRLAEFYFMRKLYTKSFFVYQGIFSETKKYALKREYFYKCINALQATGDASRSALFAHKYEDYYLDDAEVRQRLLKLYIATGNLDYAVSLSKKILKRAFR